MHLVRYESDLTLVVESAETRLEQKRTQTKTYTALSIASRGKNVSSSRRKPDSVVAHIGTVA